MIPAGLRLGVRSAARDHFLYRALRLGSLTVDLVAHGVLQWAMQIHKLAWVGTRTQNAAATMSFFRDLLGLPVVWQDGDFWVLKAPDGSKVEVFGPETPVNRHFTTGPVAGFLVDDVAAAAEELRGAGVEIVYESGVDDFGNAWVHFRAPDGNLYELTQDPGVARP